jgi:hypothetical protein
MSDKEDVFSGWEQGSENKKIENLDLFDKID